MAVLFTAPLRIPITIDERFVRASGPGGQNVNKVATAVELRFDIDNSSLPSDMKSRLKAIQEDIHATFIDLVKSRRGAKLTAPQPELFSGEYWAAKKGIEYGLVDRIGDLRSTLRERFGDKVETPLISPARGLFGRTTPGVGIERMLDQPGLADDLVSALEARALWARYGL